MLKSWNDDEFHLRFPLASLWSDYILDPEEIFCFPALLTECALRVVPEQRDDCAGPLTVHVGDRDVASPTASEVDQATL